MMRKLRVLRAEGNPLSHAVPQRFSAATQTPAAVEPEVKVASREKPGRPIDPNEVKDEKPPSFNSWLASMKSAVVSTPEEPAPTNKKEEKQELTKSSISTSEIAADETKSSKDSEEPKKVASRPTTATGSRPAAAGAKAKSGKGKRAFGKKTPSAEAP